MCDFETVRIDTYIGEVDAVDQITLPDDMKRFDCRNNRLAELALREDGFLDYALGRAQYWGRKRVGVFLGSSTSGILETEIAYRQRDPKNGALPASLDYASTQNIFSLAEYVRRRLGTEGPAVVISCACASSAKAFASAGRMISAGLIDAAVVGGVDSLCLTTLYGFRSLQLSSSAPCRPFDIARDGISIGEAGAFAWLEQAKDSVQAEDILLLGVGESSDAYHLSAPHPEGEGARRAMLAALDSARLDPSQIDYINLHGTGTLSNDRAESRAVSSVFGPRTPASSTKGATGHTLGAAGALEALLCAIALNGGYIPGGMNTMTVDPALSAFYVRENRAAPLKHVLSNSFGFGGANCSLIFGRA